MRYLISFFITSLITILIVYISLKLFSKTNQSIQNNHKSTQRVKFTVISNQPPQKKIKKKEGVKKTKKIHKPKKLHKKHKPPKKTLKHIIKKQKTIKKIKKTPTKKTVKIEKKDIIKKDTKKKKIEKNKIKQKEQKYIPKAQQKQSTSKQKTINITQNKSNSKNLQKKKEKYYNTIKSIINENKIYPSKAIRRGIQGYVNVTFIVSKNGDFLGIKNISGDKIFFDSVQEAIEDSFPITPPKNLFKKEFELSLKIIYIYDE